MYDFPVHDSTQEQNSSTPNFSSIVCSPKINGHLCQASIVEIQKFCDHHNMVSHPLSIRV